MTAHSTDASPTQRFAMSLAEVLGGEGDEGLALEECSKILNPKQKALLADTYGLFLGLAYGAITIAQPRISTNLLTVIEQIPETADRDASENLGRLLRSVLSRASTAGLTADNQPLIANRQAGRGR